MSNSSLVTYTLLSPHCVKRTKPITKITVHHVAGIGDAERIGRNFVGTRAASANYGIGSDASIGLYVDESCRAFTSSSPTNDNQAVTIEVSNDSIGGDWHVSDACLMKLIELIVDICERNNIKWLKYTGDKAGNLTRHNMFAATACPGPYLQSKFPYIADKTNAELSAFNVVMPVAALLNLTAPKEWISIIKGERRAPVSYIKALLEKTCKHASIPYTDQTLLVVITDLLSLTAPAQWRDILAGTLVAPPGYVRALFERINKKVGNL